ncbi:DH domain-containing protein [Trichonephila clavipes]|nr:DH domain-containing protein [Trichonephila clavipes]
MQVWDLVAPLAAELRLQEPRLYMAESGAPVDCSAPATLLDGEPLLLQEGQLPWDTRSATDVRLRIVEELLSSEKDYCHTLKTVADLYEKPLRKLLSMEKEDYKSLFDWVEPICSLSKMVIIKRIALTSSDFHPFPELEELARRLNNKEFLNSVQIILYHKRQCSWKRASESSSTGLTNA